MSKIIILKGTFQSFLKNKYGMFILKFEGNNLIESAVVAGANSKLSEATLTKNWLDVEDVLQEKKQSEGVNSWFSTELNKHIDTFFKNEKEENKNKLIKLLISNQRKDLSRFFTRLFSNVVPDKSINFEFNIEEKTDEEIEKEKDEKYNKTSEKKRKELEQQKRLQHNLPSEAKFAPMSLELAPVSGVNLNEINNGDMIYVKLDPAGPDAEYYSNMLKAEVNGEIVPLPAKVIYIDKLPDNTREIIVHIKDKIYSSIQEEEEEVKVKPYDSTEEVKKQTKQQTQQQFERIEKSAVNEPAIEEEKKDSTRFYFIIGILGAILLTLIVLFIMYGTKS